MKRCGSTGITRESERRTGNAELKLELVLVLVLSRNRDAERLLRRILRLWTSEVAEGQIYLLGSLLRRLLTRSNQLNLSQNMFRQVSSCIRKAQPNQKL
jgi:hypothetical protein